MPTNRNHIYAIRESDGERVFVDDVPNGKACGCICSKCREPLIARNGVKFTITTLLINRTQIVEGRHLLILWLNRLLKQKSFFG